MYVAVKRTIGATPRPTWSGSRPVSTRPWRRGDEVAPPVRPGQCGVPQIPALTYTGTAVTSVTGLDHLEGRTVSILGDGAVFPDKVVTSGAVTLDNPRARSPWACPSWRICRPCPLSAGRGVWAGAGSKNVNKVWLRLYRSSGVKVGPTFSDLVEVKQRNGPWAHLRPWYPTRSTWILTPTWQSGGRCACATRHPRRDHHLPDPWGVPSGVVHMPGAPGPVSSTGGRKCPWLWQQWGCRRRARPAIP